MDPEIPIRQGFPNLAPLRTEWQITQSMFDRFLAWLHPDRDEAGRRYETIRCRLVRLFSSKGCELSEDLADEAINRVVVKIQPIIEAYEGDPMPYFFAVARLVWLEYVRRRSRFPAPPPPCAGDTTGERECLEECMARIPGSQRDLILEYHGAGRGQRKQARLRLARTLGIEMNALRIRAYRIRLQLHDCILACLMRR
ncbi:MAG: hypothetical protein ABIG68_08260 [Acidobacteriota bacterium]